MVTTAGYTPPDESRDAEQTLLCDDPGDGSAPIKFWRRVAYTADGFVESTADIGLDGQQYNIVGTVVDCSETIDTVLPPQTFCFDTVVPETTEQVDGRRFTSTLMIRPGFEVFEVQLDTETVPLRISWAPTDTDGSFFAGELKVGLEVALPGSTVTVTPGATAGLCEDEPTPFTIDIACIERADAPTYAVLRYDAGQDLILNPGLALTTYNPPLPNGQQWTPAKRQSDGGTLICTDGDPAGADTGWQTNDPADTFELWPRWEQDGVPSSGNGGNFDYYAVTPTPRNTNVVEINSTGSNVVMWQTFTVDQDGTFRIAATLGGRGSTEAIGVHLFTGDVTPTAVDVGDRLGVVVQAQNVIGLGGNNDPADEPLQRFPWTEYQDTAFLDAGTYTLAVVGPATGTGSGGLITDLRVLTNAPAEQILPPIDDCTFDRVVPGTVDRDCQQHQPIVNDDGIVTAWRNVATGFVTDNAAFWALDPPPGCCDPLPADDDPTDGQGTTTDVARPSTEYVTEVCGVLNGRSQPLFRRVDISAAGVVLRETFIGPNGALVSPSSWEPGLCTSPGDEDQTAHMLDVTPGNPYTLLRSAAIGGDVTAFAFTVLEGTATVTDSDGTTITTGLPVGYTASWDSGGPATAIAQPIRIETTGRVIVTERHRVVL